MNYAAAIEPIIPSLTGTQEKTDSYDYQLARQIAAGDIDAFEKVYQQHHRRIYNLCLRMTNNVPEAEDLTQEVFIHVYHKIGGFRGESALATWLHRVAVNKVLMHFRSAKRRRDKTTEEEKWPEFEAPEATSGLSTRLVLDRLALDRALAQLSPGYRAVFTLHDIEGYDHNEIARICGVSVGTTKSQLHKARRRLRTLLRATNDQGDGSSS